MRHTRRDFLRTAGAAVLPLLAGHRLLAADLIPRGPKEPVNLEFPFDKLDAFQTAVEDFYVRNHFAAPKLDSKTWKLRVEGAVEKPLEFTYDQFRDLKTADRTTTMECAGNGRSFLKPQPKGVPWGAGAVGTADWSGVPLSAVLEKAGLKKSAVEVVLEGADAGEPAAEPKVPGKVHFARGLPLDKALRPEVMLAHHMNGKPLTSSHGFPVRAVVGGWYGMAAIKWLTRVVVLERPFDGYFQTADYSYWERKDGLASLRPIRGMQVKSSIARPAEATKIPANDTIRVHGAAWAGEAKVAKVEVSADGGKTWSAAKILDPARPLTWVRWEYAWKSPAAAGKATLMSRATDDVGRTQPMEHDPDRRNYMINFCAPIEVTVG